MSRPTSEDSPTGDQSDLRQVLCQVEIRPAEPADIPGITRVYRNYVLTSTATFEGIPPSEAEMAQRYQTLVRDQFPYLVAALTPPFDQIKDADMSCVAPSIIGFAYAGPFRMRQAYRYTVEDSIYIDPHYHRTGVGGRLLSALIKACQDRGFYHMLALIGDSSNAGSIRLHQSLGFTQTGCLHTVGFKLDQWLDVIIMQRALTEQTLIST